MAVTRVAVVGLGKIARDQHLPVIAADPRLELAATVDRHGGQAGAPNFADIGALMASADGFDAVAVCTPPTPRYAIALAALEAGKHVLLEKPPCATLSQVADLAARAEGWGRTLFATWHSRHAAAVEAARERLRGQRVREVEILWKEDVRRWHPGQAWIWQAAGLGVFDPGINAFSILTAILPERPYVTGAELLVPANRESPIAAEIGLGWGSDGAGVARLDWRSVPEETWTIRVRTDDETLALERGGATLSVNGEPVAVPEHGSEYAGVYDRFVRLIETGASDVDASPLQLVADALMIGVRTVGEPFVD